MSRRRLRSGWPRWRSCMPAARRAAPRSSGGPSMSPLGGRRGLGGAEHQPRPGGGSGALCAARCVIGCRMVAKVFAAGMIDFRMVSTIIARTENVDAEVMADLDAAIAAALHQVDETLDAQTAGSH